MNPSQIHTKLTSILTSADLPIAELSSARLDGELFGLGDYWCPVDVRDDPQSRALSMARLLPRRAIAELHTAAWIYGAAAEPAQHQVCVDIEDRAVIATSPRLQVRELRRVRADTLLVAGLGVTTPLRTAIDLARAESAMPTELPGILARLLRLAGFTSVEPALNGFVANSRAEKLRVVDRLTAAQLLLDAGS